MCCLLPAAILHPLALGFSKVNFIAVVLDGEVASAFIIRDYTGKLHAIGAKLLFSSSVYHAEMISAWMGMHEVIHILKSLTYG